MFIVVDCEFCLFYWYCKVLFVFVSCMNEINNGVCFCIVLVCVIFIYEGGEGKVKCSLLLFLEFLVNFFILLNDIEFLLFFKG